MKTFISVSVSTAMFVGMLVDPNLAVARHSAATPVPATPIKHLVVIFGENISFDHYFGTYPTALNPPGQPRFLAATGTPAVNGLSGNLLTHNPNLNPKNGTGATNPFRLNRNQALTADQNHSDTPEQESFNNGAMDLFPLYTGTAGGTPNNYPTVVNTTGLVMGYYDGNTVTGLWNYAQHYAMNDNSFNTQFGPSTPGAINVVSGQTNGIDSTTWQNAPSSAVIGDGVGGYTMIGDYDPKDDVCSNTGFHGDLTGKNVGDLLNGKGLTWGWFEGGFDLAVVNPNGTTGCKRSTVSPITGLTEADYSAHHQPFQYYQSTKNPNHTRPTSIAAIGSTDAANHQYDTHDFFDALKAGVLPAVSYVKAPRYQDAHPGNSNPLDEQAFVVDTINALEQSSFWSSTAVILAYDDSDGWYDHQSGPTVNASFTGADALNGTNSCGFASTSILPGPNSGALPVQGRCGYGVRTPFLVISSWSKPNFVDHTLTDQSSVVRFIEDNWLAGARIGGGSMDVKAGSIMNMFDFSGKTPKNGTPVVLSPITGTVQ